MDLDQMVTDLTCALEDINKKSNPNNSGLKQSSRAAAWAHRRSRSTSHLNLPSNPPPEVGHKSESDDTSKEGGNDSDEAERSLAKLSLQNTAGAHQRNVGISKSLRHSRTCSMPLTKQCIVESDSLNELFSPTTQPTQVVHATHSKRPRRRHKRMAVEVTGPTILCGPEERDIMLPCSSRTAFMGPPFLKTAPLVICKVPNSTSRAPSSRKKSSGNATKDVRGELIGKRKRSHREKNISNSAPEASLLRNAEEVGLSRMELANNLIGIGRSGAELDNEDDIMQCEVSSLSSLSDSDCERQSCDEGQDGDDEHSDWVGDEWIDDMDDSEKRRDLIMQRIMYYGDSREIRAGKRKGCPHKPVFSIKTSANEELSKFLQNKEQSELKLHPMRKEEQVQLSQLASLYSLEMHFLQECDPSGLTSPILTKTSNTTQMDNTGLEDKGTLPCPVLSESDTKRIKM